MLSHTVAHGISVGSWNTKPIEPRDCSSSQMMLPDACGTSPAMMRSSVLLPHPDGPRRLRNAPAGTIRSTLASAGAVAVYFADPRDRHERRGRPCFRHLRPDGRAYFFSSMPSPRLTKRSV